MKKILGIISFFLLSGCYNPEDNFTDIKKVELDVLQSHDSITADGFSTYSILVKLPGIRFGGAKKVSLFTTWGAWRNDTTMIDLSIKYNSMVDAYVDTLQLKASREVKDFRILLTEDTEELGDISLKVKPQFPSLVQIVSDSIALKFTPGNFTAIKAFFYNEFGFPSVGTKFVFETDSKVNIFPREVFIESSVSSATLQLSTESALDTINIFGRIPVMDVSQPQLDTLKIRIIN